MFVFPAIIPSLDIISAAGQAIPPGTNNSVVVELAAGAFQDTAQLGIELRAQRGQPRADVDQVGMARFNTIWQSAETLPTRDEVADPAAWVARVHG